jgi:hypothetical protein
MSNQTDAILDLEALVPTRETCSALVEADFPQCVAWSYVDRGRGFYLRLRESLRGQTFDSSDRVLPAPTAAELGAALPDWIDLDYAGRHFRFWLQFEAEGSPKWGAFYVSLDKKSGPAAFFRHLELQAEGHTEAEARALLWLRLESEGLLSEDDTTQ